MIFFEIIDTAFGTFLSGADAMASFWSGISNFMKMVLHMSGFLQGMLNIFQLIFDWLVVR